MQSRKLFTLLAVTLLALAPASAAPFRAQDTLSGKYEGVFKGPGIGDVPGSMTLMREGRTVSGSLETPHGPAQVTSGAYAEERLVMKVDMGGSEMTINAKLDGDKISGEWEVAGQSGTLELKRVAAAAGTPATPSTPSDPADPVTGEWDSDAEAQGMPMRFTLRLKVEGDKVTGSSDSDQGSATISRGTWDGNKLTFSIDTPNGTITMSAVLKDGKLVGEFDYASQFQGKWEARKK
jgi:hypothetical protein